MKEKGMTTITLKKINREKVYQYIYQQKETSKLQIVQDLQMGLSTVSQNLNELENDGLISRNGYFESTGGRKAQIIKIVEDFRISIGLGILKDMFHIVAVNLYGNAVATETIELPYENSDAYYTALAANVELFTQKNHYAPEKIEGISIANTGNHLTGWNCRNLRRYYGKCKYVSFRIFPPDFRIRVIWNMTPKQRRIWSSGIIRSLTVHWSFC